MLPLLVAAAAPLVKSLMENGLSTLAGAVAAKGKDFVEKKLGVKLPEGSVPPEKVLELRQLEFEHEEELKKLAIEELKTYLEAQGAENKEVTERWKSDMASDSWLSKNTRPSVLIFLTVSIVLMAIFGDQWKIGDAWIRLLESSYITVLVAYFGSRGAEKIMSIRGTK